MIKPYYNTTIKPILNDWRTFVDVNNPSQQMFYDKGCNLLSTETFDFFKSIELTPLWGFIWSWTNKEKCSYHVDESLTTTNGVYGAINILLEGDAAILEWADPSKFHHTESMNKQTTFIKYHGDVIPDDSVSLSNEYMTLVNVSIPHRINTSSIINRRWSYSMRFCVKENLSPSWEYLLNRLKNYIVADS
jgi:hypothetical protein